MFHICLFFKNGQKGVFLSVQGKNIFFLLINLVFLEILELGSYNHLAQHTKCSSFFFKITPPYYPIYLFGFLHFFSCKPNNAFSCPESVKVRNQTIPVHGLCCAIFCSYLSAEEREGVWCPLFDCLLRPLQSAVVMREATSRQTEKWREMLRHVISAMLGHVGHKKE